MDIFLGIIAYGFFCGFLGYHSGILRGYYLKKRSK